LEIEPENEQVIEAYKKVIEATQSPEYAEERSQKARNDPEIRMILSDMTVQKVLEAQKTDPSAIQRAMMKDEELKIKFEKLIASGIFSAKGDEE